MTPYGRAARPEWLADAEIVARFWAKVARSDEMDCWLWQAGLKGGYGRFVPRYKSAIPAHRFAYELLVGPIPEGMNLDHVCRTRACVNPAHLEPVTIAENVLRGLGITAELAARTHCKRGHPLTGENLLKTKDGSRQCKA
jgi:hypothetical protein